MAETPIKNRKNLEPSTSAEGTASVTLDPTAIRTILTLRYNTSIKELLLPKLTWEDFRQTDLREDVTTVTNHVERLLIKTLNNEIARSDAKKIALSLSGGIDSTLILSILRRNLPDVDVQAISIRFSESTDETSNAAKVAEQFDVKHHIVYIENYLEELPAAINITKLPFWDLHWYHVAKNAESLASALVSGDGGDELFGGYTFRYNKFLSLIQGDASVSSKIIAYLECHERDWVPDQGKVFGDACLFTWVADIYDLLRPYFDNPLEPLAQVFLADFNGKLLYNWSPVNTAFHDYFGIRGIAPFLSSDLIDYAKHLPYSLKYEPLKNEGKFVLRRLLQRNLDASSVSHAVTAKKQGFSVDTLNLWRNYGHRICDYYLTDARIVKEERWINGSWIKEHMNKVEEYSDPRYVNKFLGLLALEIWYRLFVSKEVSPSLRLC